jgi:ribosomal protein L11 methyltransferase
MHLPPSNPLTVVSCLVPREAVDPLIDLLAAQEICASSWDDVENPQSRLSIFLPEAAAAANARQALVEAGRALGLTVLPAIDTLPAQDWAESWKRFFRVQRVSRRIVIRPSWEPYEPQPGDCVIDLDPGMSFGTGNHATTQACLVFLDELAAETPTTGNRGYSPAAEGLDRSVLDMGCGSGILAIAARKLGFAQVAAFDNDPDAVAIAKENAADNSAGVVFAVLDLAHCTQQADVVLANILAPVLIEYAATIAAAVRPGPHSALVLSGILDTQYAAVRAAFEAQGFAEQRSLLIGEWRSGLFARR